MKSPVTITPRRLKTLSKLAVGIHEELRKAYKEGPVVDVDASAYHLRRYLELLAATNVAMSLAAELNRQLELAMKSSVSATKVDDNHRTDTP